MTPTDAKIIVLKAHVIHASQGHAGSHMTFHTTYRALSVICQADSPEGNRVEGPVICPAPQAESWENDVSDVSDHSRTFRLRAGLWGDLLMQIQGHSESIKSKK